ncbi:EF-hand calcium-binding domain-containing protein 6 [Pelodytes ibericus]
MHSQYPNFGSFDELRPQTRGITFNSRPQSRSNSSSSIRSSQVSSVISVPNASLSSLEVEKIISRRVSEIKGDLINAFTALDADQDLTVTKGEFYRVLQNYILHLTQAQFDALLLKVPVYDNGAIPYLEFLNKYCQCSNSADQGTNAKRRWSSIHRNQVLTLSELESQLKDTISKNLKSIVRTCRLFDYNQNGQIQKHELRRVLENHSFKMKDVEYEKFWNRYSVGKRNTLDYKEMLQNLGVNVENRGGRASLRDNVAQALDWESSQLEHYKLRQDVQRKCRPPSSTCNRDLCMDSDIDHPNSNFRKKIAAAYTKIVNGFKLFDAAQSGYMTLEDFQIVVNNFIFPVPAQTFQELMDRFGFKATGRINWEQFLKTFYQPDENGQTLPIKSNHRFSPARSAVGQISNDHILQKLHKHLQESYHSLKEAFLMLDEGRNGRIARKELRRVLEALMFRITDEQFKELMIVLDPEHTGFLSYHQFLGLFEEKESVTGHKWLNNKREVTKETPVPVAWDTMENILCEKLTSNWKGFARDLQSYDPKGLGIINKKQFKQILQSHCPSLSQEHFERICDQYEDASSTSIAYMEFLENLGVITTHAGDVDGVSTNIFEGSQYREEQRQSDLSDRMREIKHQASNLIRQISVDEVIEKLKGCLTSRDFTTKESFLACKTHPNGKVSKRDFRKILEDHELNLDDDQFNVLTEKMGFTQDGLGYLDFVSMFEVPSGNGPVDALQTSPNHRVNQARLHYMTAEDCLGQFVDKLREGYEDTYSAFYKIDSNRDGIITMHDMRRLMDSFMFILKQKEYERLLNLLGLNLNSTLNYIEFVKLIKKQEHEDSTPWLDSFYSPKQSSDCADLACEQAHYYLVTKAQARWHDLAKTFCEMDSEGNGIIQKKDLRNVLFRFSLPITPKEFEKLWSRYDPEGKGFLTHPEFLQKLGLMFASIDGGPSARIAEDNQEILEKHHGSQKKIHQEMDAFHKHQTKTMDIRVLEQQIKDKFREYYQDFAAAFAKIDQNKDGLITVQDFRRMLEDMNFYLSDDQFVELLYRLQMKACGSKLSYFHFLKMVDDGRASKYGRKPDENADRFQTLSPHQAMIKLKDAVASSYDLLYKAFSSFDKDGTGTIQALDLRRILDSLCFTLTEKQFRYLLGKLTLGMDHSIDWQAFLHLCTMGDEPSSTWVEKVQRATRPKSSKAVTMRDILTHVQEVVRARFHSISQDFRNLDYSNLNVISKVHFRELFNKSFMLLTDEQFENLWNKLPLNSYGNLKYPEFLKRFSCETPVTPSQITRHTNASSKPGSSLKDRRPLSGSTSRIRRPKTAPPVLNKSSIHIQRPQTAAPRSAPMIDCEEVENKLRTKLKKIWPDFHKACKAKDLESCGEVPLIDFLAVMKQFNVVITEQELNRLKAKYDLRKDGKFSYSDFLRNLLFVQKWQENCMVQRSRLFKPRIPMSSGVKGHSYLDAMLRIQPKMVDCWKPMRRSFLSYDDTRSGYINTPDFKQVLQKYGINLSEEEFFHIAGYFDKDLNSKISYNDFVSEFLR